MFMQMETITESDSGDHMTISCELHRQDGEVQMILLIYMTCLHPHTVQQHKKKQIIIITGNHVIFCV